MEGGSFLQLLAAKARDLKKRHTMAVMKVKTPATIDDLLKMPKDGQVYELVDGEIIVTPAGMRHSNVSALITWVLGDFVFRNRLGQIYTENVGIQLPTGNVRSPDVTFVRTEKLPGGQSPIEFGELVPDLAVEVLSPGDSARHIADKVGEYIECGVPLVWVVDPERKTVTAYRSLIDTQRFTGDEILTADPVLPGFSCEVSKFFAP
jgi:Uma2 family endonuclease